MGRRKKTLHDYAAEFSELAVKRQRPERGGGGGGGGGEAAAESLWCSSCQLPLRVRRDRILEHLASGRHYRNRRLARQRAPLLLSTGHDISLPLQLDAPSLLTQPPLILAATTARDPSLLPSAIGSTTTTDQAPSTSAFTALHMRITPAERSSRSPAVPQARFGAVLGRCGAGGVGLALFGTELGDKALFQSLVEENGCCLLYVVEDRLHEVERAFSAEFLASTRVLRQQDADIVLNDQRVSGVIVCSPPEEASETVIDALRAGKGVFCERLPSFDRQTAEACFDEANRCGRPLVCGFYNATCTDMACLKDADTVAVSMKFPSGAIVTLDISQHCTKSCDQRLEVHGSQGTLRVDNQNPLGITEHGTSVSICTQTQADRYREAHRGLFRHFLRTLKGKEPPAITKEQFLWAVQVAAAAEQSWRNGSAVDLRNEAIDSAVIKTEIM